MIRIAWCDKKLNFYFHGEWKNKTESNIKELKCWVEHQNIIRATEYYWLEIKEDDKIKNYIERNDIKDNIEKDYVEVVSSFRV